MTLQKYESPCNFQSVRFLGPKIWTMVTQNVKNGRSLQEFQRLIKVWKPEACACKMCKRYLANIFFFFIKDTPFIIFNIVFH